jgi:hypothetical protein
MDDTAKTKALLAELFHLQDVSDYPEDAPWASTDGIGSFGYSNFWCDSLPESLEYLVPDADERWDCEFRTVFGFAYWAPSDADKVREDGRGTWELVAHTIEDPERECPFRTWDEDAREDGRDLKVKEGECFLCGATAGEVHGYAYAGHVSIYVYRLMPKTYKWRFISYDVWGNAEDGWEVNQAFRTNDTIELPEDFSEADVMDAIKVAGLCEDTSKLELDQNCDWEQALYLVRSTDGYPEGEFQKEEA